MGTKVEEFVKTTLSLLEQEREAEIEETRLLQENVSPKELERRGVCLLKLRIGATQTGLYGRTVLVFETYWSGKSLPSHSFTPGDIAGVSLSQGEDNRQTLASGIVSRVTQNAVSLAFEESEDVLSLDDNTQYKLTKLANDVTYQRLKKGLWNLHKYRTGPSGPLISVLFGEANPSPPLTESRDGETASFLEKLEFYNNGLDSSQKEAVRFALGQRELAIIHGPPGTGKTTTIVEVIKQAVNQGLKVLACAPSNIAVDNLVERLGSSGTRVVRLGHPARLLASIHKYSLDAILAHSDEADVVNGIRKDLDKTMTQLRKSNERGEKQGLRAEMRLLKKELRQQEEVATGRVLKATQVVMATLTTATDKGPLKYLEDDHFDLIVIDECSQAMEAACWLALLRGPRCILAGDHKQLPPTIICHKAAAAGLAETLMERQLALHGDMTMRMLTVQYRMNSAIMAWASAQLYEGKLTAHESVANHLLRDLPGVKESEDTSNPVLLIDTAGCDLWELCLPDEISKGNEGEVELVTSHVEKLIAAGVPPVEIAVIAPYNLQVELLRNKLHEKYPALEIKSVDGFQGREKEAVVISLVRSNEKGEVGFLAEDRRINVAITRARRHLAVVCDSETVGHHAFLKSLVDYMSEHGEVRSAQQYIQDGLITLSSKRAEFLESRISEAVEGKVAARPKQSAAKTQKSNKKSSKSVTSVTPADHTKPGMVTETTKDNRTTEDEWVAMEKVLVDFMENSRKMHYAFPPTLTSRERFTVHEVAEKMGLLHISQGEGDQRHIIVSRPKPTSSQQSASSTKIDKDDKEVKHEKNAVPVSKTQQPCIGVAKSTVKVDKKQNTATVNAERESDVTNTGTQFQSIDQTKPPETTTCDKCGKVLPSVNIQLHQLRCAGPPPQQQQPPKSGKKKNKKSGHKGASAVVEEEDFDAIIATAMKENTTCAFTKCKQSTATLGQHCEFCAKRFCLSHHIPEVHGCGDRAKQHARQVITRDGVLHRGSGVPSKKPDPVKRAYLQRKLDKKLDDLSDKRAPQNKEKDKK